MAVPASQGEIWEVVVHCRQEGQQVLNVLHFQMDTDVDDIIVRLLRALMLCYLELLLPISGSNLQLVKVVGKRVSPDVGPIEELGPEAGDVIQGAAAGDTLPTYASICTNIHTVRGGRVGRGRMFTAGIPEGVTQGSFVQTTNPYWAGILAFVACIADKFIHTGEPLGANRISLGVMSRKLGGSKPPYLAAGFAHATRLVPLNRLSHNVSRRVGRGS